ncbi:tetratricopeptide repeat protein [Prosthecomicrobium pneumaticum]|uniref:Tetratricopeptide (TPR) repeat protein n=1 Tax=Prosthecomicrobium pneumaticum TaxID=81895 RepID=A0A7W9CU23_9HYPH|nr:hypothetical protein [Prosthecomicrobium pneumaticum]MBB5751897.1 tetratricopeptide (TPR) repeat protein [Prosthecomicrobium pneumaticum]
MPRSSRSRHSRATRRSRSPRAWLLGGATLLLSAWLAWEIVHNTAADTLVRVAPEAALAWRPNDSEAHARLASGALAQGDAERSSLEGIAEDARAALLADPLERSAWQSLAIAADLGGDEARAEALIEVAARRSRRDPLAEMWLLRREVALGRYSDALAHADALLRTNPRLRAPVTEVLLPFLGDPKAEPGLVDLLVANPPWRATFLGDVGAKAPPERLFGLLQAIGARGTAPSGTEIRMVLDRFIGAGRYQVAFLAWLSFLPQDQQPDWRYIQNGDFEAPISGQPFDWTIGEIRGAATGRVEEADGNHVLRVEFAGTRVPYRQVGKLLLLPPGSYRLTGREMADGLVTERGLAWHIVCADGDRREIAATPLLVGTVSWRSFEILFDVPQEGCTAQSLRLELAVKATLDQEVKGIAAYDDLVVERVALPSRGS